jgi:hypothetical protein
MPHETLVPRLRGCGTRSNVSDMISRPRRPAVQEILSRLIEDARAVVADPTAADVWATIRSFEHRLVALSSLFEEVDR